VPAAAIAIPMAISAGASIWGAAKKSSAAKKAGQIQSEEAGRQAEGFRDTLAQWNPQIGSAAEQAAAEARAAAAAGQAGATSAAGQIRTDALGANELLQPYIGAGAESAQSLREFMAPGGVGQRAFTAADMAAYDPGYQFRLDEAAKAVQSSAAARGGALGGGALKALQQRSQDVASSEFGAASDRFRQQQQDRFARLFGTAQLGGQYAGQAGQNLLTAGAAGQRAAEFGGELGFRGAQTAGQFGTRGTEMMANNALDTQRMISDLMTGGAAAQAAGKVGSANAWGDAATNVGNTAMWAGSQYQANKEGEENRGILSQWMNPALQTQLPPGYDPGTYRPPDWNLPR
jgi:hypothetical protein